MPLATSAGRVVGGGLLLAAMVIVALSVLVLLELDRESRLQRDVIAQIEATDEIDALRGALARLGPAARIAALTGTSEAQAALDAIAREVDESLVAIAARSPGDGRFAAFQPTAQAARLSILNARSIADTRRQRGRAAADAAALEAESTASDAAAGLERVLDNNAAQINRQALAQLRTGEALRRYVMGALVGSIVMLAALYLLYRGARRRERAALRRIEQLAHFDAVTGLPNRALLGDRLVQEVARAHRSERPFALLSFDLDGFKAVNDTWGHAAGDAALAIVASRARAAMRASDTVGRQGGDEFLALLPETALDGAQHVAEKLRASLAQPYPLEAGTAAMSTSIGLALFPDHGSDADALQRAADAALYEAKREGKNRVKVARRAAAAAAPTAVRA